MNRWRAGLEAPPATWLFVVASGSPTTCHQSLVTHRPSLLGTSHQSPVTSHRIHDSRARPLRPHRRPVHCRRAGGRAADRQLSRQRRVDEEVARPAAAGQFVFIAIAFGCLAWSFVGNDFSVLNVATNSNSQIAAAVPSGGDVGIHEGSLLLWTFMLSVWMVAVTLFSHHLPTEMVARVLSVMAMISSGFLRVHAADLESVPALVSDSSRRSRISIPCSRIPAMVAHPPMLYMGYVGIQRRVRFRDLRFDRRQA